MPTNPSVLPNILSYFTSIIGRRRRDRHGQPQQRKGGPRVPRWLARKMGQEGSSLIDSDVKPDTLTERSLEAVAEYIRDGKAKRIIVLTGAGISTAAGIPDFRSPGTGLYANLARLNLPHAEAVFDISYFRSNPEPFYMLARELYPGKFHPTISHAFIALLSEKGLLDTLFTQNIDCLERRAGVPGDKVVEAHGSFATQRCIDCKKEFDAQKMVEHVDRGEVPRCEDSGCQGLVKPDIVFFGEQLPKEFDRRAFRVGMADLVLIIGTSLSVYPFAALPDQAQEGKPRMLFNLERVGQIGSRADDVIQLGDCDAGIRKLADALGWRQELEQFWEGVVGKEEAEKQRAPRKKHNEEVEDEVDKLTKEVESALNLEEAEESKGQPEKQEALIKLAAVEKQGGEETATSDHPELRKEISESTERAKVVDPVDEPPAPVKEETEAAASHTTEEEAKSRAEKAAL